MNRANRYFSPERQAVAAELYAEVKALPLVCPHGHVDPGLLADPDYDFGTPVDLLIIPDHYIFRMLYSQGISLESLGIPRRDGGSRRDRSPQNLADSLRPLGSVSRHADRRLAERRTARRVRHRPQAEQRQRPSDLRRDCREAGAAGISPARAVRALQHRDAGDHRRRHRHARLSPSNPRLRLERARDPDLPPRRGRQPRQRGLARQYRYPQPSVRHRGCRLCELHPCVGAAARPSSSRWARARPITPPSAPTPSA